VTFDATKLSWIGNITSDPYVGFVWHAAPVKTLAEARNVEVIMGGNGVGSASVDYAIIAKELFGYKFKIVTGYKSSSDTKLAIERQEIDGTFGNGWTSLKTGAPEWLSQNKVRVIVQFGFKHHPELPDVPLFIDSAEKPQDRQLLELMLARQEFAKPYFAPPGVPTDRLTVLRRAFDAAIKDPQFIASAQKANLALDGSMTGEELSALTNKLAATPPSVVKYMEDTFAKFLAGNK
jgi:tripartite-type tricarboxylate transporter receptor subunit TctC